MIHTTHRRFPNGATVLLVETHQAPVVSINICLRVGSRYENDSEAGICHLIEHMLFKGTQKLGPGEVAKQIEALGGDINAYTSFDETVYYCTLSSRYQDRALEILSDAVLNSVIHPVELDREREVVVEEILRGKDSPSKVLSEELFAKAYQKHPYGRPIIGYEKTVRGFSQEKVFDFYRRWYVPENMVVVIAGNIPSEKTMKQCESIFASLPAQKSLKEKPIVEPAQNKTRSFVLSGQIQGPNMAWGFPIPGIAHEDVPALDLLSHILGEGENSRLEMKVKGKQGLVNSIYSYAYTPEHPGLFMLGYTLQDKNLAKATQSVFHEIERLQDELVDYDDLVRAKINIKSDAIYEKETVEGLTGKYGYFETILRDYRFDESYYQRIDQVTREKLLEVARQYLPEQKLTLGLITSEAAAKKLKPHDLNSWLKPTKRVKRRENDDEEPRYVKLKNGLRLILKSNHQIPAVAIRSAQLSGLRSETPRINGINSLLAQLWGKSTARDDAQEFARQIELVAGNVQAYAGKSVNGMKVDFISEKIHEGMRLFLDAYLDPRFDEVEIVREKDNILEAIRREEDAPAGLAFKNFLHALYPKHPYGMSLLGTSTNISRFKRSDILKQYQLVMNPKSSVISIVGDFEIDRVLDMVAPALEAIPFKAKIPTAPKADPLPKKQIRLERHVKKLQAHIVYGFRGLHYLDEDRYALEVLNHILSGQGGRLFLELRDKQSLAYSVTAVNQEGIEPGYFGVYIASEASKTETAIEGIERELGKLLEKKISQEELRRAQQYLIGSHAIDLQRNASMANHLAFQEIVRLPQDAWRQFEKKILAIKREDIDRVAHRILKLKQSIVSVVRSKP